MNGARVYYAKQNKSLRERQMPYNFTHMWNLRNNTDEHREGKEKQRGQQTIRDLLKKKVYLLWEKLRPREWGSGGEGGRQRIPSRLCTASAESGVGLEPTNREIMIWAEIKRWTLYLLSHPGNPRLLTIENRTDGGRWVGHELDGWGVLRRAFVVISRVLSVSDESLNSTPETNTIFCIK